MILKRNLESEALSKLKILGFRMVDDTNIYYDEVYGAYFLNFLVSKRGLSPILDEIIDEMMKEIGKRTEENVI